MQKLSDNPIFIDKCRAYFLFSHKTCLLKLVTGLQLISGQTYSVLERLLGTVLNWKRRGTVS